jgi:uncharacterized protein involved in response to NO
MSQTNTCSIPNRIKCLFAYPFRIFFLSMACWAVLVIPLWIAFISGLITLPLVSGAMPWHQHEMLFGYVTPAIAGFLLTAVCVWTQTERLHGRSLALLWAVWLAGRLSFFGGEWLPYGVVVAINLAFLPLLTLDAGRRIWQAKQPRQIPILLVLGALWLVEAAMLLSWHPVNAEGALILIMALMLIVGGRITPTFSDSWLKQRGGSPVSRTLPWLEKILLPLLLLLLISTYLTNGSTVSASAVLFSSQVTPPPTLFATLTALAQPSLALLAAGLTLARLLLWRGWHVSQEPLLWSLHVALLWIPVALVLLAGGKLDWWSQQAWLHAAGIGAIGGLILAVISRVSLGHTGRPLLLPKGMVAALWCIHVAAMFRVATAVDIMPYLPGLTITAALWTLAFLQFLIRYSPILTAPRPDGREG